MRRGTGSVHQAPDREYVNGKPVVHFSSVEFREYIDTETAKKVEIGIVSGVQDHPRLGRMGLESVYTSEILLKCEDGKSFETRNTFYRAL